VFTFQKALGGIAAIVVLVFAGAGAATLFSSSSTNSSRTISFAGPRGAIQLALAQQGFGQGGGSFAYHGPPAQPNFGSARGSGGFGSGGGSGGFGSARLYLPAGCGKLQPAAGKATTTLQRLRPACSPTLRVLRFRSCRPILTQTKASSSKATGSAPKTTAAPLARVIAPLVASLFGNSVSHTSVTGGARAQTRVIPCATPVPMNHLPGAGSPGTGSAPQTSSSPPRG
jgi:hypothetical protein